MFKAVTPGSHILCLQYVQYAIAGAARYCAFSYAKFAVTNWSQAGLAAFCSGHPTPPTSKCDVRSRKTDLLYLGFRLKEFLGVRVLIGF